MLKERICSYIDDNKKHLFSISKKIYDNPELGFKEFIASQLLASELEKAGFKVNLGVAGLETAIFAEHPKSSKG